MCYCLVCEQVQTSLKSPCYPILDALVQTTQGVQGVQGGQIIQGTSQGVQAVKTLVLLDSSRLR